MEIAILGTGCTKCDRVTEAVRKAVEETGVPATVRKVSGLPEILSYRAMTTPAVAIDGKVRIAGRVPTVEEVKTLLASLGEGGGAAR